MIIDYTTFERYATNAHAYVLLNFTTGEVRCTSCDLASVALRSLYKRFDSELRSAKRDGYAIHQVLANVRTGKVVAIVNCDFAKIKLIKDLYESLEG
jgi:hypothetical protein